MHTRVKWENRIWILRKWNGPLFRYVCTPWIWWCFSTDSLTMCIHSQRFSFSFKFPLPLLQERGGRIKPKRNKNAKFFFFSLPLIFLLLHILIHMILILSIIFFIFVSQTKMRNKFVCCPISESYRNRLHLYYTS